MVCEKLQPEHVNIVGNGDIVDKSSIRRFVQETLGCTCPDEVFHHVECQAAVSVGDNLVLDYEINIGNRLLIYVASVAEADSIKGVLSQLVRTGMKKRNKDGFNRFRIVLLTQRVQAVEKEALDIFNSLGADEKIHLHVIGKDEFRGERHHLKGAIP